MSFKVQMLLFFVIAFSVLFGIHWVVYRHLRFAFDIPSNSLWLKISLASLAIWLLVAMVAGRNWPNAFTEFMVLIAYYWLGFAVYLFVLGFSCEILSGIAVLTKAPKWSGYSFETIRHAIGLVTFSIAILLSIAGIIVANGKLVVRQIEYQTEKLDPSLNGFKIVMVSDIHLGAVNRLGFANKVATAINDRNPDLVVIPGDVADGDRHHLPEKIAGLNNIHAKYGKFWSTGNHEYYTGTGMVTNSMAASGIPVLRNSAIPIADGKIFVAGVNDPTDKSMGGEGCDIRKALSEIDRTKPVILLSHQPRQFRDAFQLGADIMLSGHTHGGQTWPFNYIVDRVWEIPRGSHYEGKGLLYVSVGCGTWGPPMRLSQPPELVEITLKRPN